MEHPKCGDPSHPIDHAPRDGAGRLTALHGQEPEAGVESLPFDPQLGPFNEVHEHEAPLAGEGLHEHPVRLSLVAATYERMDVDPGWTSGWLRSLGQFDRHVHTPADEVIAKGFG